MIYEFNGYKPVIHPSSFVHKEATVIGNVIIGENVYIGPGASLRGDWGQLNVGNGCNVQDNCILHIFPGKDVILEENAHIGHGAIVHGAHIGKNSLVKVFSEKAETSKDLIASSTFVFKKFPPIALIGENAIA